MGGRMRTSFHVRFFAFFKSALFCSTLSTIWTPEVNNYTVLCVWPSRVAHSCSSVNGKLVSGNTRRARAYHARFLFFFDSSALWKSATQTYVDCLLKLKYVKRRIKDVENNRFYGFYSFHPVASRQHVRKYDSYTSRCTGLKQSQYTWR